MADRTGADEVTSVRGNPHTNRWQIYWRIDWPVVGTAFVALGAALVLGLLLVGYLKPLVTMPDRWTTVGFITGVWSLAFSLLIAIVVRTTARVTNEIDANAAHARVNSQRLLTALAVDSDGAPVDLPGTLRRIETTLGVPWRDMPTDSDALPERQRWRRVAAIDLVRNRTLTAAIDDAGRVIDADLELGSRRVRVLAEGMTWDELRSML